jgi:hypothetical protein
MPASYNIGRFGVMLRSLVNENYDMEVIGHYGVCHNVKIEYLP